jgi:dipeptidyl aminopeptidase/acylaminoacyl peptidase
MRSKQVFFIVALIWTGIVGFGWYQSTKSNSDFLSPLTSFIQEPKKSSPSPLPLAKYEFEKLRERGGRTSKIILQDVLDEQSGFISYLFSFKTDERNVTGLLNLPLQKNQEKFPVVLMLRGYVDQEIYETGVGTRKTGEMYAKNGFLTIAPDFLGYGKSDMPPVDVWEERFLRLTTVLDLLASLNTLPQVDTDHIFLWGHSNGGMIALSTLELTGRPYPTSLWAPVSQYFPYDILYYTFEFEDKGKALRKSLAEFESVYDVDKYSFDEYSEWITAPIILHQGTADPYIPEVWSDNLHTRLTDLGLDIEYYTYMGADHNLNGSWNTVVQRDLQFFKSFLINNFY